MVAIPITLPMGWKNSPPLFFTGTETVADLANESLRTHHPRKQHLLDIRAEAVEPPPAPLLTQEHANLTRDPYLRRPNAKLLAYVDVFVDDFLGLAQGTRHRRRHVRRTLFHALDKVFRVTGSAGRQPAQRSTNLEEARRRGLLLVNLPDHARVDC